ncbi:MAG: c-type cytochrome [Ardenticatenaceae bacterium]
MRTTALLVVVGLLMLAASYLPWSPPGQARADEEGIAAGTPADAERGRLLFAAKGCAGCHRHEAISSQEDWGIIQTGPPELTDYQADPTFLRAWLRDPGSVRPGTGMPNLNLRDEEIEALIAFLSVQEP